MAEHDKNSEKTELSISSSGVKLSFGDTLLHWIFGKRDARIKIDSAAAAAIASKLQAGEPLSQADLFFFARFYEKDLNRLRNVETIVNNAQHLLTGDHPPVCSDQTSERWRDRFVADAQDITDSELQDLYSRILAAEITRPCSFSLRTLSAIRDLEKEDALLFEEFVPFVFDSSYLPSMGEWAAFYAERGLTYDKILRLRDVGLMSSEENLGLTLDNLDAHQTRIQVVTRLGTLEFTRRHIETHPWPLQCMRLTNVGSQLARIPSVSPDMSYIKKLALWVYMNVDRRGAPPYHTTVTLTSAEGAVEFNSQIERTVEPEV